MNNTYTPEPMIRRALIGNIVRLPDGQLGKVTGITTSGIARVSVGPAIYVDCPQDALTMIPRTKT